MDLVGKYFRALYLTGDTRDFYFLIKKEHNLPSIYRCPHDEGDGQEQLKRTLKAEHLKFSAPNNMSRRQPSFWNKFSSLMRWLIPPKEKATWPLRSEKWRTQESVQFTFNTNEVKKIKELKVPLNVHLIHTLNHVLQPFYNKKNSWWLMPVALPDDQREKKGNNISFIDILLTPTDGTKEITDKLKNELKEGGYWGHRWAFELLRFIPARVLSLVLPFFFTWFQRTITFSHLGNWRLESEGTEVAAIPPVFSLSPLFVVVLEYNGKLNLSFSMQPHLNLPLEKIMDQWRTRILAC